MKMQKLGGYAAIGSICAYLAAVMVVLLKVGGYNINDPVKLATALLAAPGYFYVYFLLMTISWIALIPMALALQERMQTNAPHLTHLTVIAASVASAMQIAGAVIWVKSIGIIDPIQDIAAYKAIEATTIGLLFMASHAAAWATLFIGCAILRTRAFSQSLGWLFLFTGVLWLPLFVFSQLVGVVALLDCIAYVWIGIALLRQKQPQPAAKELAASK